MDELANPQWQALPPAAKRVLQNMAGVVNLESFYLAGGTALALRLGHRISVDLDFFGDVEIFEVEQRNPLITQFRSAFSVQVVRNSALGLTLIVDGVAVSFFTYTYPMVESLAHLDGIPIANLADVGLMKIGAISDRAARKDFVDLYFIAKSVSLEKLFEQSKIKYPGSKFFETRALEGLVEFDIADAEEDPQMLRSVDWEDVKAFFIKEAVRLGKKRFEDL